MKNGRQSLRSGFVYAFAHFATEVACFFWVYSHTPSGSWIWALSYDFFAFAPQIFFGMFADRHPSFKMGPWGLALMAIALFLPFTVPAFFILTMGNCMVHIAGAEATARKADGKMAASGIFVGAGSFGVILGRLCAVSGLHWFNYVALALLAAGIVITSLHHDTLHLSSPAEGFHHAADRAIGAVVLLTFITVAARSFIGYSIPTAWISTKAQLVMLFVAMGIGKIIGGIIADRFGARRTAVISLAMALPMLVCGNKVMIVSLMGVALFSMTMSISYGILLSLFPLEPGFAFGITTLGLFAGTVPSFLVGFVSLTYQIVTIICLTAATIFCFILCSRNQEKGEVIP